MILNVYSIYDIKSEVYSHLDLFKNNGEALRFYKQIMLKKQNIMTAFPEDFFLHRLGQFDDSLGCFKNLKVENVCCLNSFRKEEDGKE